MEGTTNIEDSHPLPILISPSSLRWTMRVSTNPKCLSWTKISVTGNI